MENLYIFAINVSDNQSTELQELNSWSVLNGLKIKPLQGAYKGAKENSYMTRAPREIINFLAHMYNQESVLELGEYHPLFGRKTKLIYLDGRPEIDLGYMRQVSKEEALKNDAWTYDISQNMYFLAK